MFRNTQKWQKYVDLVLWLDVFSVEENDANLQKF